VKVTSSSCPCHHQRKLVLFPGRASVINERGACSDCTAKAAQSHGGRAGGFGPSRTSVRIRRRPSPSAPVLSADHRLVHGDRNEHGALIPQETRQSGRTHASDQNAWPNHSDDRTPSTSGYAPGRVSPVVRAFSLLLGLGACGNPRPIVVGGPAYPVSPGARPTRRYSELRRRSRPAQLRPARRRA